MEGRGKRAEKAAKMGRSYSTLKERVVYFLTSTLQIKGTL